MLSRSAFAPRHKNSHKADTWKRCPRYLQWLRGRRCALDGRGGCGGRIEAAHIDYAGLKGVGSKVEDKNAIPLCSDHHRSQHAVGWPTFEGNFKFNGLIAAQAYWHAWPGRRAWELAQ